MADREDIEFREESEYKQEGYSMNEIILRHIRKMSDISCQEFTGGYWNKKPIKTQSGVMFTEEYHEDKREAYCNAVDFLIDVIYPMGDKDLKTYIDSNDKDFDEVTDDSLRIKKKLKLKRGIFKEINKMFDRTNFWQSSDVSNE